MYCGTGFNRSSDIDKVSTLNRDGTTRATPNVAATGSCVGTGAKKKSGLGSKIYSGVAMYGRFRAVMGAIIGVIIALIIIIIGVSQPRDPHTEIMPMTITSVSPCSKQITSSRDSSSTSYQCSISVSFPAADGSSIDVQSIAVSMPTPPISGDIILLRYDPVDPTSVVQEISPRALGWSLIGGGVLLGGFTVGLAVLAFKSKGFAAIEGAAGLLSEFRH